jgi:hypothetical protein
MQQIQHAQQYDATPLWERMKREGRRWAWLAEVTGYDRTYLYLIRAGRKPVTEKFMDRVAAAFGLERGDLFAPVVLPEGSDPLTDGRVAD